LKSDKKFFRLHQESLQETGSVKADDLFIEKHKKTHYVLNNIISFFIYLGTFFIFNYIKRNTLLLSDNYIQLLGYLIASLILGTILSGKFNLSRQHEISQIFRKLYISLVITLGSITILLILFEIKNISRFQLLGTMVSGFIIEAYYYYLISERRHKISLVEKAKVSFNYMLADAIILTFFIYLFVINNIVPENINDKHLVLISTIYISWLFSAATTHKYNPIEIAHNKWHAFGLQLKYYILILSLTGLAVFLLQISAYYWGYFLEAVLYYSGVSLIMFIVLFAEKVKNKTDEVTALFLKAYEMKGPAISPVVKGNFNKYAMKDVEITESVLKQKLEFDYLRDYDEVFRFLDRKLELKSFDTRKSHIIRSADPYNIKVLPELSYHLIVNLHELNDLRGINNYLREINKKLVKGGVFVGTLIPNKNRYQRYLKKYPYLIANIFAFFDFIWKRMFPKIPITRKIYFALTKGKDRAISLAEGLGRLVYTGFEILDLTEINNNVYFAVVKAKEVTTDKNPFYSPVFKMRRIGKDGKIIYVYKLRTMHPYSEFIQDFVYRQNQLEEGGKFKDDFRIPGWGKIIRRLWIDELPMLFNWIKGDLKLVGVRPISNQYMSLYSKEHQELRKKFKPGLVPPFYADLPKTIEEIEKSERIYLEAYKKNPFRTDINYFLRALGNIVLKRKRSA
jgi:lipopolysaccharide/colanic/teichoic acid biosynthesis glycosyltransferase